MRALPSRTPCSRLVAARRVDARRTTALACSAALALGACASEAAPSSIDAVIVEASPGLGVRLERVRLVVERLSGDGRFHDRTPDYGAARTFAPIPIRVRPEAPDDAGRQLYRLRAEGYVAGVVVVALQHRVVFVPGRTITLPFRLEPACLEVPCGADTTCSEGRCIDDLVEACGLEGAAGAPFCRGDAAPAGQLDASRDGGPEAGDGDPGDAARGDGDPGECVCRIDGSCRGLFERNPTEPCELCDPVQSTDAWSVAVDFPCDDGLYCTLNERCGEDRVCADRGADRRACWDGNGCTMDICDEDADVCRNPPQPGSCSVGGMSGFCCRDACLPTGTPCT